MTTRPRDPSGRRPRLRLVSPTKKEAAILAWRSAWARASKNPSGMPSPDLLRSLIDLGNHLPLDEIDRLSLTQIEMLEKYLTLYFGSNYLDKVNGKK